MYSITIWHCYGPAIKRNGTHLSTLNEIWVTVVMRISGPLWGIKSSQGGTRRWKKAIFSIDGNDCEVPYFCTTFWLCCFFCPNPSGLLPTDPNVILILLVFLFVSAQSFKEFSQLLNTVEEERRRLVRVAFYFRGYSDQLLFVAVAISTSYLCIDTLCFIFLYLLLIIIHSLT